MKATAFVKIVEEGRNLYYQAVYTDYQGKLWNVLDSMEYPWAWGFSKLENALKVVRAYNWNANAQSEDEVGRSPSEVAAELASSEHEDVLGTP